MFECISFFQVFIIGTSRALLSMVTFGLHKSAKLIPRWPLNPTCLNMLGVFLCYVISISAFPSGHTKGLCYYVYYFIWKEKNLHNVVLQNINLNIRFTVYIDVIINLSQITHNVSVKNSKAWVIFLMNHMFG